MTVALIVAVADNGVIGRGNDLPWHQREDLRRLKKTTLGHHFIMGRRTWESVGKPLPGRCNVVVTRQEGYEAPGAVVVKSVEEALALAAGDDEPFIAGGAELFRAAMPRVERMYLTRVHASPEGDTFFPEYDPSEWVVVRSEFFPKDERNDHDCTFEVLERKR